MFIKKSIEDRNERINFQNHALDRQTRIKQGINIIESRMG